MLRFLTRPRHRLTSPTRRTTLLSLEPLEARDCPAAPVISLTAVPTNSGRMVQLSGMVTDENPAGVTITFSGVANGTVTANASGQYTLTTQATGLGMVNAVGMDQENLSSNMAMANVASNSPMIVNYAIAYGTGKTVTLSGSVMDEAPGGLTVNFSGQVNGSATTDGMGNFSLTAQAAALGPVNAQAQDPWALSSTTATVNVASNSPMIINFAISYGSQRTITVSGKVIDESPGGLAVNFTGPLTGSATTDTMGNFTLTGVASGLGTVQATATDVWGLVSAQAQVNVTSNLPNIMNFQATHNVDGTWTFQGQVLDESATGLVVRLGGLPALAGVTATVDATGWFSWTGTLPSGTSGQATAQTTDWWGLDSNLATYFIL